MEVDTVTLEDNKKYAILDTILIQGVKYIYLSCIEEEETGTGMCIRKLINHEEDIAGLDTEEEFKKALQVFAEKYEDVLTGE